MSSLRALRQLSTLARPAYGARSYLSSAVHVQLKRVSHPAARMGHDMGLRAFSSSGRRCADGAGDVLLSQKLGEELKYEKEAAAGAQVPESVQGFLDQKVWKIEDVSGHDEVTLTRTYNNETIRLMFSIADIQTADEDQYDPESTEPQEDEPPIHSYPVRASFAITKTGVPGSINVDTMCQDATFVVDNISYYPDTKLGTELTAEADWKRRGMYIGPSFDSLDVTVQEEFEKYLQERGINESLALFVPEYAEYKEQKEYVRWLENIKKFIDV